ncbi:1,2-phenylacetyl-CoA epoxidase subunit PaaA [Thermaerobacter subterraneus]|uniref:Phenylacetate-CoA oxygenase, PaaG subunit n=1 Tax=Thermaerobacter subterraneus DSM 13965 TaxID=867903 RepID=K6Q219_9FIRM|nr:1,2-phenylacetyl-CoA epoxidase subunit PaaA [Thermaerobacter subterraneus]EKP95009.1 phenylacetate-CoA oxygenase, PaaG subunit [Thermaerobacter subterraneus DSM 13965]
MADQGMQSPADAAAGQPAGWPPAGPAGPRDWREEERIAEFTARLERGEKVEAGDWMPSEYRRQCLRLIQTHANSEIMGALPEREWIPRAPTLRRKLALMAKVQDEVGHAQLIYRVAEDLAAPLGITREDMMDALVAGKAKFHNVFSYPAPTWADAGIIAWLVDGAALVTQAALLQTSYAPYARILRRICAEEAIHLKHGEDIILTLMSGTRAQQQMVQHALNRWWRPLLHFFGPPDEMSPNLEQAMKWRIKVRTNEELRQEFLSKYVPQIRALGLQIPDPELHYDEAQGRWVYGDPDWDEFWRVVKGQGPRTEARLAIRRLSHEESRWVREALARGAAAA